MAFHQEAFGSQRRSRWASSDQKKVKTFSKKVVPNVVHVLLSHWKLPLVWFVGGVSCANAVTYKAAGERWPNAFFAKQGLFSLKHAMKRQAPQKSRAT